jgi:hypothetical protein
LEGVVTNLEELAKLPVQTIAKIAVGNIWLGAHPGKRPSVSASRCAVNSFLSAS